MTGTIEKYLSQIMEVTHVPGIYAYRGQQDLCWPLHSAATRRLIERYGKDLLEDPEFPQLYINYHQETLIEPARTRGFGTDSGRRLSDLELLAKLQHFGAATGLLDFTWSPLVALWFACEDTKYDGKLLIVDTNVAGTVGWVSSNEEDQNLESAFSGAAGSPQFSYWEPTVTSDASVRILRQRSVFIIGRPLVPVGEEIIKEITIAKEDKQSLKKELATLDVQEDSLFQDIYGFAQASNRGDIPDRPSEQYGIRGNRYYQRGEYTEAMVAYSKAVELAPDVALTYLLRGNVYAASGRHREAIEDYDKAVARINQLHHSTQDAVYFNRGNSKAELADYEGALQDYSEAISLNPSHPQYYYNRGNTYADLYRFNEALLDYDQVGSRYSGNTAFNKGNTFLAMGRLSKALRCYQDAVAGGVDHVGINQNTWTLEQMLLLVDGLEYTVSAAPEAETGRMCLRFGVPEGDLIPGQGIERFLFFGRAGSVGNSGGPGLSGGEGFSSKPIIPVYVDVWNENGA